MPADKAKHEGREASEHLQQGLARVNVLNDDVVLVVRQRAGLFEDLLRHRELADVVQEAAGGKVAKAAGRETELVTYLRRT